jgi:hypothetical protein
LAKELGKSISELEASMDAYEFMEWIAFSMTNDPETKTKLMDKINLEKSANKTADERALDIKKMFQSLGAL